MTASPGRTAATPCVEFGWWRPLRAPWRWRRLSPAAASAGAVGPGVTGADLAPYNTVVVDTAGRMLDALAADIIADDSKMGRGGVLSQSYTNNEDVTSADQTRAPARVLDELH